MKMKLLFLALALTLTQSLHLAQEAPVCKGCPAGQTRIGLKCYTECPRNYFRFGYDCQQRCPAGKEWKDDGMFCRIAEYGRGNGYAWTWSDGEGNRDSGPKGRCESENGVGNCEKFGFAWYPKCKPDFKPFGCCICRPVTPNCIALGFNSGIDVSCTKKIIIGQALPCID